MKYKKLRFVLYGVEERDGANIVCTAHRCACAKK